MPTSFPIHPLGQNPAPYGAEADIGQSAKFRTCERGSATFEALAVAILVLCGFATYAFVVPREFEGTGVFTLSAPAGVAPEVAAGRVDDATLAARVAVAARVFGVPQRSPEAALHAASVKIESKDGATFIVRCRASEEETARERCSLGMQAAASAAASTLDPARGTDPGPALAARVTALTSLASTHPELLQTTPETPPSPDVSSAWRAALTEVERAHAALGAASEAGATPAGNAARVVRRTEATITANPPSRTGIMGFGLAAACFAGLVTRVSRRRAAPVSLMDDVELDETPSHVTTAPEPPPPRPVSSAPPPAPSSYPPPRVPSSLPPAPSSRPPAPAPSSRPPAPGSASAPPLAGDGPRTPFTPADPPPPHTPGGAGLEPRPVKAESFGPKLRTTQILGSPIAPRAAQRSSSSGSFSHTAVQGSFSTRYSFVTTPPPPGGVPVEPHDIDPDWKTPPRLDPTPCRALAREIFAYGIDHCFTVGVTSVPGLDEEKSEFAASLALALAHGGHARVLLVDSDFDRPALHRLLELAMPAGRTFSRQLQTHMMGQTEDAWSVLRCSKALHALLDGTEHTPGLILSRAFETCLRGLRAYYDFIVLDGPPGNREAECRAFDAVADGLIVVCTEELKQQVAPTSRLFSQKRFSRAIRVTKPET